MKRGQQFGSLIRGKKLRKTLKKMLSKAKRTDAKRRLKKDPNDVETKPRNNFWGYDD